MEHGIVRDWNDMERIWQYIFSKDQLQTFPEEVWYAMMFLIFILHQILIMCSDVNIEFFVNPDIKS